MSVFERTEQVQRCWHDLSDLDHLTVSAWKKSFQYSNNLRMPIRLSAQTLEPILDQNREFIDLADQDIARVHTAIGIPHLFLVTDSNGVAIHLIGPEDILERALGFDVGVGTSFTFEHAGINGVSLAMRLQSTVVVQGSQHTLRPLKDWACICSPVRVGDEICGYINFSFSADMDVTFAVPLLKKTVEELECKLKNGRQPKSKDEAVHLLFEQYNLSKREKEVAFGWLQNKSVLQMAHSMGIKEGTVRNMLKKVYAKTGVSDKGQFFMRFLV